MKLFYSPGACSLSPHILLKDTGLSCDLVRVDLASHKTESGEDYTRTNPKGSVPLLMLDDGSTLTEGPVICQYICDRAERPDLMPAAGTMPRYRVMEWQNYITSELHKSFGPLFSRDADPATKKLFNGLVQSKLSWVSGILDKQDYLTGATFTAADAYLFTVASWSTPVGLDLGGLGGLTRYLERVRARPAVQAALKEEGLLK